MEKLYDNLCVRFRTTVRHWYIHFLLTPYPSNFFDLITRLVVKRYIQLEGKGNLKSFDK